MTKLGKTNRFPEGKLRASDEGELKFAVTSKDKLVEIHFGTPVAWFAMPADIALQLAESLIKHANAIKGIK
jgi:hypothetical protein